MTKSPFLMGAVVLGGYGQIASWRRSNPDGNFPSKWEPSLIVMQADSAEDGVLSPAREVTIGGREALLALRSAIDEALKTTGAT